MSDIVMVAVTSAFFVLCVGYVRWCDHIIGSDPTELLEADAEAADAGDTAADRAGARA
jgi:hypothetical protein